MSYTTLRAKISSIVSINALISGSIDGREGEEVALTAAESSGDIAKYVWDFGDGERAEGVSVTHTWDTADSYTVTLRVTGSDGGNDVTTTIAVIVAAAVLIVADAGGPYSTVEGQEIVLDGSATVGDGIIGVRWDPGDGSGYLYGLVAAHTYTDDAGSPYTATIEVFDDGGLADSDTASVTVAAAATNIDPTAEANGPYTADEGEQIQFSSTGSTDTDGYIVSYSWDFDDGETSNLANPLHAYAADGSYTATLTVTDNAGGTGQDTASVTINNVATDLLAWMEDQHPLGPWERILALPVRDDYPRVSLPRVEGSSSNITADELAFYDMCHLKPYLDTTWDAATAINSSLIRGRIFCPQEYQGYNDPTTSTTSGPQCQELALATGPLTTQNAVAVFPGHFLFKAYTTLTEDITSAGQTSFTVASGARLRAGYYAMIYEDAEDWSTAEQVYINTVSGNTITVTRSSWMTPLATTHAAGKRIALHQGGNGGASTNKKNVCFNLSTSCPQDANGETAASYRAKWIARYYKTKQYSYAGNLTTVPRAIHADSTFWLFQVGGATSGGASSTLPLDRNCDCNNDGVADGGVLSNGVNAWGEGLESYYTTMRSQIESIWGLDAVVQITGGQYQEFAGSAGGAQLEDYWDGQTNESQTQPPLFIKTVTFESSSKLHTNHAVGPPLIDIFYKTNPDNLTDDIYHRAWRFAFGMGMMYDQHVGPMNAINRFPYQEEMSVIIGGGSHGTCVQKTDSHATLRANKGWLGAPLDTFRRQYDSTTFAWANNLLSNGDFNTNTTGWSGSNCTISRDTGEQLEGAGCLLATMTKSSYTYPHAWSSASITSPSFSLTAAQPYTVCFAIKGDRYKNVRLDVGGIVTEDIYVRTAWQRHVYAFVAPGTGSDTIQWQVGAERGNIYLDQVYIRQGHGAVMRRDFENGIVLVNPAKADATVDLGGTFYRLDGNRAVNDGSELSGSVTVPAQDALILVKPL